MAIRPFNFYVEMEKNDYTPVGEVKQLDTMELDIKVLENGVPKNLESSEIALYIRKKDGTILEQKDNINVVEASEGAIKIKVKNQATACVGMTLFELELKGADGIATTGTFIFIVNERVVNGEVVESKDEIHALVEVEKYVKLAKEELQRFKELQTEMLRTNETINLNEEGRASAEEKRVSAENKRALAEEERGALFTKKEEERGTLFAQKELDRNNTFVQGERERNERFEEAERNRAVAEDERVIAEQERKEKFAGFENKINVNTEELEGARTATTGEQFNSLDERIDNEVDRLNKKIEVSMLQQEDKESHTVENTVEGMTTDMAIKGRTLQNLIKDGKGTFVIDKSQNESSRIKDFKTIYPLQKNKEYVGYLIVNNIANTENWLSIYGYERGGNGGIYGVVKKETRLGVVKFKWTPSNGDIDFFDTVGVYLESTDFNNGGKATFSNFMLFEEGTDLTYIDEYFEEIKSFGQQEDKISTLTHGKNLVDFARTLDTLKVQYTLNNGVYSLFTYGQLFAKGIFTPKTNNQITFSCKVKLVTATRFRVDFVYDDGFNASNICDSADSFTEIKLVSNPSRKLKYVRFNHSQAGDIEIKDLLIEESSTQTSYEPYISDKKDIILSDLGFDEGLRGIGGIGGITDELSSIQNRAVKRIEKYTFNGDENLIVNKTNTNTIEFRTSRFGAKSYSKILSNLFPSINGGDKVGIRVNVDGDVVIHILKTSLTTQDIEGFKKWLKENPTIIYYGLKEPIETPLDENINLKVFNEKTHANFENALSGTSSFKVPANTVLALSNLTDDIRNKIDKKEADEINERATESLELSEYNHSDINDNIFPYLMDIELMVLDMLALNGYTNKKYKIMERAGIYMTSKQALERLIRQKKVTLEDALDRIVRYNDAGRITDAEALELTDLANEIL